MNGGIPDYALYGEQGDLPDLIHIETIRDRAPRHGWDLAPHRHARLWQLLLLETGGGLLSLDGGTMRLVPGTLVVLPAGSVHGFRFDPGTDGLVLSLPIDHVDALVAPALRPLIDTPGTLPAPDPLRRLMREVLAELEIPRLGQGQVLRGLATQLLGLVARSRGPLLAHPGAAGPNPLVQRLQALVERHFRDQWGVTDYAAALGVTAPHLSRLSRQHLGRPVSRLAQDRVIREARRLLTYTDQPIAEIAYALGYDDPAHFSRVFARATGLAPTRLRKG